MGFRELITQVGNALGLVRLLRSASINACSKAAEFVPALEERPAFYELAENAGLSQITRTCGARLDQTLEILKANFSERTDFLRLMVKNLAGIVEQNDRSHLDLFYILIPALTLNYVENILIVKEKLTKKNPGDAFLTDDGFSLGLAYFLKLLELNRRFEALHWFDEMSSGLQEETVRLTTERTKKKTTGAKNYKTNEEEQNMQAQLSLRRIRLQLEEFRMLHLNWEAAAILFREE
eukprot:TRINITY_DN10403_c0_g1_i5.p1 TRINITY_DN10403_c0_g1~~TRINITY_DN10403_c0_g1_i5.p1  ORF type:complete len:268 (+),score=106.25 TRINITY_DN10403_c0_g1_i5:97-804(+)